MVAALPVATTGLGIASSAAAAAGTNRSIRASMRSQSVAAQAQQRQLVAQTADEQRKNVSQVQALIGRIRAGGGEAGIGTGGTMAALERQAIFDAALNDEILNQNLANNLASVRSGYQANAAQTASQARNPIFDGFLGGVQGLTAGLQIADGIDRIMTRPRSTT